MEQVILSHLIENEDYSRQVLQHLNEDLFHDIAEKTVFNIIEDYINEYNALPTKEAIYVQISKIEHLNEAQYDETIELVKELSVDQATKTKFLVDETETWMQKRSMHNAIRESIRILDGTSKRSEGDIEQLIKDAQAVSFDATVGHDFLADAESRFRVYHEQEDRIPFKLSRFNGITGGGAPSKTFSCFMAGPGVGKSLFMCHMAADNLRDHKNVLYITLEMSEERIAERIDCNLMDATIEELKDMSEKEYLKNFQMVRDRYKGNLIIKEYPTTSAGAGHFRHLLGELRLKKNFVPDIIYIDYLNLCTSMKIRGSKSSDTYTYVKAVAEELRGLAVEFDVPIISATQLNRDGIGSSDVDMTNTADSIGLPMTLDYFWAIISTPELEEEGKIMVKQLKNRYGAVDNPRRFILRIDRSRFMLMDGDASDQEGYMGTEVDTPVMDNTDFAMKEKDRFSKFREFN